MEPRRIPRAAVLAMHAKLLAEFSGLAGLPRPELLQSALARPRRALTPPTLAELAAAYGFGLARSHCFADGNKRIALAVIDVFLRMNGAALDAAEADATEVLRDVASGQMDEAQLSAWIAANLKRTA